MHRPRLRIRRWFVLLLAPFAFAPVTGSAQSATGAARAGAPGQVQRADGAALILGVPFVSFADALQLDYEAKDILNPSLPAALAMVLRYWGQDPVRLASFRAALPEKEGWARVEHKERGSLADLRRLVDRGVPVVVTPTWLPDATIPGPVLEMLGVMKGVKPGERGRTSGVLPPFHVQEQVAAMRRVAPKQAHWESLLITARVVVGYDDSRRVIILHDPSFGPAHELSYADFDAMWSPAGRRYMHIESREHADALPVHPATPYRPRTPDERAAERYVRGYAQASVGKPAAAIEEFDAGLALEFTSPALRMLLLVEQGFAELALGRPDSALRRAEAASAEMPGAPLPWHLRAQVAKSQADTGAVQRRHQAELQVQRLCADQDAVNAAGTAMARWFFISYIGCGTPSSSRSR